jgi:hypothetical protein
MSQKCRISPRGSRADAAGRRRSGLAPPRRQRIAQGRRPAIITTLFNSSMFPSLKAGTNQALRIDHMIDDMIHD